ncbi:MAG: hypothetical protein ACTSPB_01125 [Candidatus Thorarchaeota archaeon]
MSIVHKSYFSEREYRIAELLKEKEVKEVAEQLDVNPSVIYSTLYRMRIKIEKARNTVNTANNWLDSGKSQRLGRLLRKQEPKLDNKD